MKLKVIGILLAFFGYIFGQQPQGPGGTWNLVFEDNFDGSTLNTQKWNYNYTWGRTHNHRAYMVDSMVKVVNGQLRIKAKHERNPSAPDGTDKWSNQFGYIPFDYTSGAVNTNSKFNFAYGYLEGSFKAPATLGTWPAFWTLNANGAWPPEIDVLEIPKARNEHHYYYHYKNSSGAEASFGTTHTGPDKSAAFHTYGVEWGPTYMKFYFDGQLLNSYTNRTECNQGIDMYVIINLAVGGWAGDIPANAVFPCYFYSDWVRVWKKDPVGNLDFEATGLAPWGAWNTATQTTDCKRSGSKGVKLTGNPASIEQTVDLSANTTYIYGGYAKAGSTGDPVMFGVKNYGGDQLTKTVTSTTAFVRDSIIFKTGTTNTSAVIFFYKNQGTGSACGDDFFLRKSTVKDCAGQEGGTAVNDACGVCVGGSTKRNPCKDLADGNYTIKPLHSGLCLEPGTEITQQPCNAENKEIWIINQNGQFYQIKNVATNQYLAVSSATSGNHLTQTSTLGNNALWRLEDTGGGNYNLVPSGNPDLVVDVNSAATTAGVYTLLYNRLGADNQKYVFTATVLTDLDEVSNLNTATCYPNPFEDHFILTQVGDFSYEVLNNTGSSVASGLGKDELTLGEDLRAGVYTLKVETQTYRKFIRIVKQ